MMRMLETLAAWVVTYAVHSTLLLSVAWLLTRVLRDTATREIVWKGALLGGIVSATTQVAAGASDMTLKELARRLMPARAQVRTEHIEETQVVAGNGSVIRYRMVRADLADPEVLLVWGLLAAGCLVIGGALTAWRVGQRRAAIARLHDRLPCLEREWVVAVDRLRWHAGMARPLVVTTSDRLRVPAAIGLAEICLPPDVVAALSPAQRESVLAHEVAHLARRDPLWLEAADLIATLFFFQPLNRLARAELREAAEFLCDDAAVRTAGARRPLAECLAALAATLTGAPSAPAAPGVAFVDRASPLVRRVRRVLDGGDAPPSPWARARALALSGALLVGATAFAPGLAPSPSVDRSLRLPLAPPEVRGLRKVVVLRMDAAAQHLTRATGAYPRAPAAGATRPTPRMVLLELDPGAAAGRDAMLKALGRDKAVHAAFVAMQSKRKSEVTSSEPASAIPH